MSTPTENEALIEEAKERARKKIVMAQSKWVNSFEREVYERDAAQLFALAAALEAAEAKLAAIDSVLNSWATGPQVAQMVVAEIRSAAHASALSAPYRGEEKTGDE